MILNYYPGLISAYKWKSRPSPVSQHALQQNQHEEVTLILLLRTNPVGQSSGNFFDASLFSFII